MGPQRILFITPNFPPYAQAGAARTGALALHWARQGHKVTVIGARIGTASGIHTELDHPNLATHMLPIDKSEPQGSQSGADTKATPGSKPGKLKRWLWLARQMPDRFRANWVPRAVQKVIELGGDEAFDLVYSSGPPHSVHIAAGQIASATGLPWICEQRDLWVDNPYIERHPFLTRYYEWQGRRVQRRADAFVAVTDGARQTLARQTGKRVELARNGWVESDFEGLTPLPEPLDPGRLTIIHAGLIYAERRDPKALFEAIAMLGEDRRKVRAIFYHDEYGFLDQRIAEYGVSDSVEVHDFLPRSEVLAVERAADVLLMCRWPDPAEDHVIPGKLFEYIGARRPILATGLESGEAVQIVRDGNFGIATQDPSRIAEQLRSWLALKDAGGGRIPDLPEGPAHAYTRDKSFVVIDELIEQVMGR
ncbi:glycosyltransferase [Erythrobacter aquimaris]|uniref:Glycosyltransferase n=1 Tax=Qipengyuania aquimaris TaxID=255984 RepID=A0A6I4TLB8_9SPHN|nr:glycosyltransferase family 4 protein [Qipengyuania aquimaris]MXO96714.1 glycosyltransferase [Qipengyuania aquimaris]